MDLYIAIPAWNEPYLQIATQWTIPAVKAALAERASDGTAIFCAYTDNESAVDEAVGPDYEVHFYPLRGAHNPWGTFMAAHRTTINTTPIGAISILLNADIIVSNEFFRVIDDVFANPTINVMACLGVRAELGEEPPIGVDAQCLMQWAWTHRHQITRDCTWPSRTPHVVFLPEEGGVSAHSWYLTPIALRKTEEWRYLPLYKTIDDSVLGEYADEEIHFITNGELFYLELSPPEKRATPTAAEPIGVDGLIRCGKMAGYCQTRNFTQRITVLGNPSKETHPVIAQILEALQCVR